MAFVRKKPVTMDGVAIVISPLLSADVDSFLGKQNDILSRFKEKNGESNEDAAKRLLDRETELRPLWLQFICDSLNQADPDKKFSPETLHKEFDKVLLERLRKEIMDMSGIGQVTPGEA